MRSPQQQLKAPPRRPRVLAAVVALSLAAWVVLVSAGTTPEVDASTAQQTLAALDDWLGEAAD